MALDDLRCNHLAPLGFKGLNEADRRCEVLEAVLGYETCAHVTERW